MRLSYEDEVKGRTVIDASGTSIGELEALYLDSDSIASGGLRVSGVRVKLHSDVADAIGVTRGTFRAGSLDVPAEALRALGDAVLLNVTVGTLAEAADLHPATG